MLRFCIETTFILSIYCENIDFTDWAVIQKQFLFKY
jgi:hypothetical protein